jgi:hypothetical protein
MRVSPFLMAAALAATSHAGSGEAPVGDVFPSVQGSALDRTTVELPAATAGSQAVLLVAYTRGTQPDVDLWADFLDINASDLTWFHADGFSDAAGRELLNFMSR